MDLSDIKQMRQELLKAGWIPIKGTIWKAPCEPPLCGQLYRGPAHAFDVMTIVRRRRERNRANAG